MTRSAIYMMPALGSKQVLSFDLQDTLRDAGANPADIASYFVRLSVRFPLHPVPAYLPLNLAMGVLDMWLPRRQ